MWSYTQASSSGPSSHFLENPEAASSWVCDERVSKGDTVLVSALSLINPWSDFWKNPPAFWVSYLSAEEMDMMAFRCSACLWALAGL